MPIVSTSIYLCDGNAEPVLLSRYKDVDNELEAIHRYVKSIGKECSKFTFLGELSGMVYRMSFEMTIDDVTKEYMVIVNTLIEGITNG